MQCEHNIDRATLQHRYYNYLTSWLVYIKSCSQHILTVPLYEEYHHHHHSIPPPSPRHKAAGPLCSSPLLLSPPKLKGTKFSPVSAPKFRNVFL